MGLGAWLSCPAPDQTVAREAPVPRCQRVALGRPFLAPGRAPRSLEPRFQGSPFWETRSLCGASGSRPPTLGLEFEQWALRLGPCLAAPAWRPLPRRLRSARRLPPARPPRASALPVWPAFVVPLAPLVSWTALLTGLLVSGSWWFWSFLPKGFPPARGDRCLFTLQVKH